MGLSNHIEELGGVDLAALIADAEARPARDIPEGEESTLLDGDSQAQ
jgi:hypothetical protein